MPGYPYPGVEGGVEPGYDAHEWAPSIAGRGNHPGSRQHTMFYSPRGQGPPLATGRHEFGRQHSPSNRRSHYQHAFLREEDMNPYHIGRHRAFNFVNKPPGPPSFGRFHSDEGDWFDEQSFEDLYGDEERVLFPPRMGHGRPWNSSNREAFEEALSPPRGGFRDGIMPHRGEPRLHRGHIRRSSSPPFESPPDSPPSLSLGTRRRSYMDPRTTRGRGMSPSMMNRGGMHSIPVYGGPPLSRGNSMREEPVFRKRARFVGSPSSIALSDSRGAPGFQRLSGGFRPPSRSGGSIKRAMKWLTKPNTTPTTLHPILRTGSLIRPVKLAWDVNHPPSAVRAGLSPGVGVASFSEPATSPPVSFMRLLVPIPGLDGARWMVDVWPFGSPSPLPISPFPDSPRAGHGPHVRCSDVLHALYRMLCQPVVADDFLALDARRRDRVSKAFWVRCRASGVEVAARGNPSLGQEEMDREVQLGVKMIDFMEGRTRWEGLEWRDTDAWVVKLGRI